MTTVDVHVTLQIVNNAYATCIVIARVYTVAEITKRCLAFPSFDSSYEFIVRLKVKVMIQSA